MEVGGGYEGIVAATLAEADPPIALANPRQARKFARAIGRLATATLGGRINGLIWGDSASVSSLG